MSNGDRDALEEAHRFLDCYANTYDPVEESANLRGAEVYALVDIAESLRALRPPAPAGPVKVPE